MNRRRKRIVRAHGHLESCGIITGECQCAATALHEAGHAVVAWALGVRVRLIDARSLRGSDLASVHVDRCQGMPHNLLTLAGPLAEVFETGRIDLKDREIAEVAKRVGRPLAILLGLVTLFILRTHRARVAALASVMLRGTPLLRGREVRALLGRRP